MQSSNLNEVVIDFHGNKIATHARLSNLVIEGDSINTILMLMKKADPYWSLQDPMSSTHNLMFSLRDSRSNYMFINGNKVADALANISTFTPNLVIWDNIFHIPGHV